MLRIMKKEVNEKKIANKLFQTRLWASKVEIKISNKKNLKWTKSSEIRPNSETLTSNTREPVGLSSNPKANGP